MSTQYEAAGAVGAWGASNVLVDTGLKKWGCGGTRGMKLRGRRVLGGRSGKLVLRRWTRS